MYTSKFRETYLTEDVLADSPEICFMQAACKGDAEKAVSYFEEEKLFGGRSGVYAPQGKFLGLKGIKEFAEKWKKSFDATEAVVYPVVQTRSGGRSATELTIAMKREKGDIEIPMIVIGDLRPGKQLDEVRIYFFFRWTEGFEPYREPIFQPSYPKHAEFALMTGAVREYFKALHKQGGLERIMEICSDDVCYGGYRPEEEEKIMHGKEEVRKVYEGICADAPEKYSIRAETLIDDGHRCVVEWNMIVTEKGRASGFLPIIGAAVYERGDSGKLISIRICDDNGFQYMIDQKKHPEIFRSPQTVI